MAEFKTFSFKNVNVIFGISEIQGFADGDDAVKIEGNIDAFTLVVGAKGDATRTQTNDDSVTVTLKLLQTSSSYPILQNIHTLDKETGAGVLPMTITDKETGETFIIPFTWINKQPAIVRGQNQNPYEIIFSGNKLIPVVT